MAYTLTLTPPAMHQSPRPAARYPGSLAPPHIQPFAPSPRPSGDKNSITPYIVVVGEARSLPILQHNGVVAGVVGSGRCEQMARLVDCRGADTSCYMALADRLSGGAGPGGLAWSRGRQVRLCGLSITMPPPLIDAVAHRRHYATDLSGCISKGLEWTRYTAIIRVDCPGACSVTTLAGVRSTKCIVDRRHRKQVKR